MRRFVWKNRPTLLCLCWLADLVGKDGCGQAAQLVHNTPTLTHSLCTQHNKINLKIIFFVVLHLNFTTFLFFARSSNNFGAKN